LADWVAGVLATVLVSRTNRIVEGLKDFPELLQAAPTHTSIQRRPSEEVVARSREVVARFRDLAPGSADLAVEEAEVVPRSADGAVISGEVPVDPWKSCLEKDKS
jgi:phage gp36-like protein